MHTLIILAVLIFILLLTGCDHWSSDDVGFSPETAMTAERFLYNG